MMHRQTVYFGAKLDEKFWHFGPLKNDDHRRLSLPRIASSDSDDDDDVVDAEAKDRNVAVQNRLVR